jgi:hypothetical protein
MLSDDDLKVILDYLSTITGRAFNSVDDLLTLGTNGFLDLAAKIDDAILPIFISMFKSTLRGRELFYLLTEGLDESMDKRATAFFNRYMDLVLVQEDAGGHYNPLVVYLAPECFDDLAFIQSRQSFFLRQTINTINEFLNTACGCDLTFAPGRQEEAWKWFWDHLLKR